jgi:hypothetical protein
MKKLFLVLISLIFIGLNSFAQKAEVVYFKANLACCQAKACDALEGIVKEVVEKSFPAEKVSFKEIKIADESSKDLVAKYNAKSQTVVIVSKSKKKETSIDVSDIIVGYSKTQNKQDLEKQLVAKINAMIK